MVQMTEKEKITITVEEETAEIIRQESERIGNSKRYMGRYVDRVVQNEGDDSRAVLERLDRIESELMGTEVVDTTESTQGTTERTELEQKVGNEEPIDPAEYDLSELKGSGKAMDAAELVVRHEKGMTEEEIEELFSSHFGYSINAVRQKKRSLMGCLISTQVVTEDDIEDRLRKEMREWGWHQKQNTGDLAISPHRNASDKEARYLEMHGGGVNKFLTDKVDTTITPEYVTEEGYKEALEILYSRIDHIDDHVDNFVVEDRVKWLGVQVQEEIDAIED